MEDNKKVKRSLGRNFKQGMYYSIVTVFVIAMVIIINMFVTKMDIKLDFTKQDLYTLTDATKEYVSTLEDDITIYFLAKENDKYEVLQNVINQYGKLSHISVVWKDPELYPQFAAQYTDSEVTGNDVIVVNETKKTSKFIAFSDMYIEDYSMNYSTYNYDYSTTLDAEGQITAAIQSVPAELYESVALDGANFFQKHRHVTIPSISPTLFFLLIINVINSVQAYAEFKMMTQGGPAESTNVIVYEIYQEAFINSRFGVACAESVILFVILIILTALQFRLEKKVTY